MANPIDYSAEKSEEKINQSDPQFGIDLSQKQAPFAIRDEPKPTGSEWLDTIYKRGWSDHPERPSEIKPPTDDTKKAALAQFPDPGSPAAKKLGLTAADYTAQQANKLRELTTRKSDGIGLPRDYKGERLSPTEESELTAWEMSPNNTDNRKAIKKGLEQVLLYGKDGESELRDNPLAFRITSGNEDLRESKLKYGHPLTLAEKEKWKMPADEELDLIMVLQEAQPESWDENAIYGHNLPSQFGFRDGSLDILLANFLSRRRGYKF